MRTLISNRIGALDIAAALTERIGAYIDLYSIEFLAVEGSRIQCWYQGAGTNGPTYHIEMLRDESEWALHLSELPSGTEQQIEVP